MVGNPGNQRLRYKVRAEWCRKRRSNAEAAHRVSRPRRDSHPTVLLRKAQGNSRGTPQSCSRFPWTNIGHWRKPSQRPSSRNPNSRDTCHPPHRHHQSRFLSRSAVSRIRQPEPTEAIGLAYSSPLPRTQDPYELDELRSFSRRSSKRHPPSSLRSNGHQSHRSARP